MSTAFEDLLNEIGRLWSDTRASPDSRLLRTALLRRFVLAVHARRSAHLASGDTPSADRMVRLELFVEECLSGKLLESIESLGFEELVRRSMNPDRAHQPAGSVSAHAVPLPEALGPLLDTSRLERRDRRWERALVIEAYDQGWSFWQWSVDVEIHQIEAWADSLGNHLWPDGILFYVESDGFIEVDEADPSLAYWRGRWLLGIRPESDTPDAPVARSLASLSWPGSRAGASGEWKLLLPARPRAVPPGKRP